MAGAGSKPGERRGGRQKGTPNKASIALAAEIAASGETPLNYMLRIMRDQTAEHTRRDDMAKASAPYVHPKLAAIEHTGKDGKDLIPEYTDEQRQRALAVFLAKSGGVPLGVTDGERAAKALKGIEGKRLTYGYLTKPRTLKQEARHFLRWRRRRKG